MTRLLLTHGRQCCLHTVVGAQKIDIHHLLHLACWKYVDWTSPSNTCTRDYQVYPSARFESLLHQCLNLGFIRDIGENSEYGGICLRHHKAYFLLCPLQSLAVNIA